MGEEKITNEYLANKLSYSVATIHRALNNCPGVDSKTKSHIRHVATEEGFLPELPVRQVAVILPAVPNYFWGQLRKELISAAHTHHLKTKYYIYQSTNDASDALQCITTAQESGASVFICALPDTPAIRMHLEELASHVLVLLLEQFIPAKNTFFIGGDPYKDGYELAKIYSAKFTKKPLLSVLRVTDFETERERIRGFLDGMEKIGTATVTEIAPMPRSKTQAAYYARALSSVSPLPNTVFCPSGQIHEICLAATKIKKPLTVIGFDDRMEKEQHSALCTVLSLKQSLPAIADTAILLTRRFLANFHYPDKKYWHIAPAEANISKHCQ